MEAHNNMGALVNSSTMASIVSSGNSTYDSIPWIGFTFKLVLGIFVGYIVIAYVIRHSQAKE